MPAANDHHRVAFFAQLRRLRLALARGPADGVFPQNLRIFFHQRLVDLFKPLLYKRRLRHNQHFIRLRQRFGLLAILHNPRLVLAKAVDAHHFRVLFLPGNDHLYPLLLRVLHNLMNPGHKRAGGVYHGNVSLFTLPIHLRRHAVAADDHRPAKRHLVYLINRNGALCLQPVHHGLVMDNRPQNIHRLLLFQRVFHRLHRAFHAKTKPVVFSLNQLHWSFACFVSAITRSSSSRFTFAISSLVAFLP